MTTSTVPAGATVYTDVLRGCTLDELLEAAERHRRFPGLHLTAEWGLLRAWAIAVDTVMVDRQENADWEAAMTCLVYEDLPYTEWVAARLDALKTRERARKLAQDRLRHRYGYKRPRRIGLIARDIVDCLDRWMGDEN